MKVRILALFLIAAIALSSSSLYLAHLERADQTKAASVRKFVLVVDWRRPAGGIIRSEAGPVMKAILAYGAVGLPVDCPVVGDVTRPTFNGSIPGPLIEVWEGEVVEVTVMNNIRCPSQSTLIATDKCYPSATPACYMDLNANLDKVTTDVGFHAHGLVQTDQKSDGSTYAMMKFGGNIVASGQSQTYRFFAPAGSAGYYMYHDHGMRPSWATADSRPSAFETDHVGSENGLYGPLIIRPQNYVKPDRAPRVIPLFMVGFNTFNNRIWASNIYSNAVIATQGEELEIVIANIGSHHHVFHIHSHSWKDPATGITMDSKGLMPGEVYGFKMMVGNVGGSGHPPAGSYMYHCHVNEHMMAGMWGELIILGPTTAHG